MVGVFVDAPLAEIVATVAHTGIRVVQLHGDEPESYAAALKMPLMRAAGVDVAPERWAEALLLLDAVAGPQRGGTGTRVDWQQAAAIARRRKVVLAGGLTPGNVAEAVAHRAPVRRGRVVGRGGRARPEEPGEGGGVSRERARGVREAFVGAGLSGRRPEGTDVEDRSDTGTGVRAARSGRARLLRRVRGTLRARNAGRAGRGADGRLPGVARRRALPGGARLAARHLRRASDAAVRDAPSRRRGLRRARRADPAQARGPHAHRRAQDQQRARAGAARQADGQAPHRRRNRRRPARRGHGHGVRAARPRVPRLHGRRGHAPPGAQRRAHAAPRRVGRSRWTRAARR